MMAERTLAHQEAFVESAEAEYFSSADEIVDKVRYYLAQESDRLRIAEAGHQRCLNSGYSNHSRMSRVVDKIKKVFM
jgi:spore maturation protein CgeB